MSAITLDGNTLSLEKFRSIVFDRAKVSVAHSARERLVKTRHFIDEAARRDERVYSVNTGFGILSKVKIPKDKLEQLQLNIVRSHCAGVGEPHSESESRAILLLRTNVLAKGFSGVRAELVDLLVGMLNQGVHPVIPNKGSVGASGDLAPLAHVAAVLIGEGEAFVDAKRMPGSVALKQCGLRPVVLQPKEGLALINGTQQMTGWGATTLLMAEQLIDLADLICTASLEGVLGSARPFAAWVHETRPFEGQKKSAALLRSFMEKSEIWKSHYTCERVQDPYSFRCAPQVHGAIRDLLSFVRRQIETEMNSATDNPLVHPETGEIVSGGNFHGQPIAFALDILGMALSEISSLSERRIAKLMDPGFSELPAFLIKNEGLNSGLMMAQVTAAALVSENKGLCHPASTDSIPTNNEKEDHVSMGPNAARKASVILANTVHVLAIEALSACQALEFRRPLRAGVGPEFLHRQVRSLVPPLEQDRVLTGDIETVATLIRSGKLHESARQGGLL
jgi:histidine ammonia-lyase